MPHKHTRKDDDDSNFNLPPSEIAKPLPVTLANKTSKPPKSKGKGKGKAKSQSEPQSQNDGKSRKRKRGRTSDPDDAPRSFKRLMALSEGQRLPSGLDDGRPVKKSGKKDKQQEDATQKDEDKPAEDAPETPKIRPGERLADFSSRVDAALPLGGLVSKTAKDAKGKDVLGFKVYRTRKERKMHKLYDQWREEEAKIQSRKEEELERIEEEELDKEMSGTKWKFEDFTEGQTMGKKKGGRKGKKGKWLGESAEREKDPWQELKEKRGEAKIGLHDVVLAPPDLIKKAPTKLTVRGAAAVNIDSVPKASGSLRRREELQIVRQDVVEKYRQLMSGKRTKLPT